MSTVDVELHDALLGSARRVGMLSRSTGRSGEAVRFEYDETWLRDTPFALDHELPLASGSHYAAAGADQLSGAFQDASPDRWGKMLMDRREVLEARDQARPPRNLRSWDYLLGVHDESRMGALRLRDSRKGAFLDARDLSAPPHTELRALEAAAHHVECGDDDAVGHWIRQLIAPGASLGGARPKAGFRAEDGSLWMAKFPALEDRRDAGLWEFLANTLARQAGIDVPPARALKLSPRGHTFAVRRFDRVEGGRRMYASAMTRLALQDSEGASYLDLVAAVENDGASGCIDADLAQLYRRALFNVLIGNRDDHLRNHGFLRRGNGWVLSPAFDVNPNPDKVTHVLALDERDTTADSKLLTATADFYRLSKSAAAAIEREVREAVRSWQEHAKALGLRAAEIESMCATVDPER